MFSGLLDTIDSVRLGDVSEGPQRALQQYSAVSPTVSSSVQMTDRCDCHVIEHQRVGIVIDCDCDWVVT